MSYLRDTYAFEDFTCGSCLRETLGILIILILPSISCAFAPATTLILVTGLYTILPMILGCFWSVLLWGVCSVLVYLRLLQASAEISRYRGRSLWFRAVQLLSMHDLTSVWSKETPLAMSPKSVNATSGFNGTVMKFGKLSHKVMGSNFVVRAKMVSVLLLESIAFFAVGLLLWVSIPFLSTGLHRFASLAVRTSLACCSMLVWLDAIDFFLAAMVMCAGKLEKPLRRTQIDPLLSLSLTEFWGRRWNSEMSTLLKTAVYFPSLRAMKGATWLSWIPVYGKQQIATVATFGMSGLLHAYVHVLMNRTHEFNCTMGFFLIQPVGMLIEKQLRICKWNKTVQRIWTMTFLLVTFPLLSEPMQQLLPPSLGCLRSTQT